MIDVQMTDEVDEAGVEELRNAVIAFNLAATGLLRWSVARLPPP